MRPRSAQGAGQVINMCSPSVLVVENELLLNFEYCDALRAVGFDVVSTCHAADALKVISEHAELSALVTDIDLDDDCDGFDLARHARAA